MFVHVPEPIYHDPIYHLSQSLPPRRVPPHCPSFVPSRLSIPCFCLVMQRCTPPSCPLSTGLRTPQTPLEEVTLTPRQPLLAGQIQTRRPQKVHPKVGPNQQPIMHAVNRCRVAPPWLQTALGPQLLEVEPSILPYQDTNLPLMLPLRAALHPPSTGWLLQLRSTHLPRPPWRSVQWSHLLPTHRQPLPARLVQTLRQLKTSPKVICV